jgi:uroporphyrinogen-III synthase
LVTRPEPGALETAAAVAALGFAPVLAPALVLASRPLRLGATPVQAVLLASRAAARSLSPVALPAVPLLAVGGASAAEARAQGFTDVRAASGDAAGLAALAAARLDPRAGPLLLACGAGEGLALAGLLRAAGFRVLRRIVYAARPATALPAEAATALATGNVVAALFFSPRSAECAISLVCGAGLGRRMAGMLALTISPRVADAARNALAPLAWGAVRTAVRPDQAAVLDLLAGLSARPTQGGELR